MQSLFSTTERSFIDPPMRFRIGSLLSYNLRYRLYVTDQKHKLRIESSTMLWRAHTGTLGEPAYLRSVYSDTQMGLAGESSTVQYRRAKAPISPLIQRCDVP